MPLSGLALTGLSLPLSRGSAVGPRFSFSDGGRRATARMLRAGRLRGESEKPPCQTSNGIDVMMSHAMALLCEHKWNPT